MTSPEILFENDDVLVINKPAGLVVHADGRTAERTLVDWLLSKYPDIKNVGDISVNKKSVVENQQVVDRPGIVHRLDRETSGAMVIAKNQDSYLYLKRQFQDREVKKKYHLFVWGEMKDERGIIDRPIGKSPRDFRQKSASRGAKGEMREAITWFRVIARGKGFSFVEAQPRTGRTHQIRVHFKAIGHPVVSDSLYAERKRNALGFLRTALHSHELSFTIRGGKKITVIAPYPDDFQNAMRELSVDIKPAKS